MMTKKINEKVNGLKGKAAALMAKASLMATSASMAMYDTVYATDGGAMGELLETNLTTNANRAITAVAAIMGVGALVRGAFAVKEITDSQDEGGGEQRRRGQNALGASIGAAVTAGVIYGIRGSVVQLIVAAMSGS